MVAIALALMQEGGAARHRGHPLPIVRSDQGAPSVRAV